LSNAGSPIEAPPHAGQRQKYFLTQINAFAKGDRHNDIYNRMRWSTTKPSEDKIEMDAEYYAAVRLFRPQD
jgi:cytochrome c553